MDSMLHGPRLAARRVLSIALVIGLSGFAASATAAPRLSISPLGYKIESVLPVQNAPRTYEVIARAAITNTADRAVNVTAQLRSATPHAVVIDGAVSFGNVPRTSPLRPQSSIDTFAVRFALPSSRDVGNIFQFLQTALQGLSWTVACDNCAGNRPPLANAGPDQTAFVHQTVTLDGSGSSDPDGDALSFEWSLMSRPAGSAASLSDATDIRPQLTLDVAGSYVLALVVSDGKARSAQATVTVATRNSPPVARAGADQTSTSGSRVQLDGSTSTDVDGDALSYDWSLVQQPEASAASIENADPRSPFAQLVIDRPGQYVAQLIVNDGTDPSAPDTTVISTVNSAPVAHAGSDTTARVGERVELSAIGSSDADGDTLAYRWALTTPAGSSAILSNSAARDTSFVVDRPGTYLVQLIVNDSSVDSAADTVVVSTLNSRPVAVAGADVTTMVGQGLTLDGGQSRDVDGDALAFSWSLVTQPEGSSAQLEAIDMPLTAFVADLPGLYVIQLIVSDGTMSSEPGVVRVTAEADTVPPAAAVSGLIRVTVADEETLEIVGMPLAVEAGATVRIANTSTGESVLVMADEAGAFTARIAGTSADALVITVIDAAGNASAATTVAAAADILIDVLTPLDGATVEGNTVLISGTLHAPADTGLAINGHPVPRFGAAPTRPFTVNIALEDGENTLNLVARRPDGTRMERTLRVTRTGDSPFSVLAIPGSAIAPAAVTFTIEQHGPETISHVDADFDGNGTLDKSSFDEVKNFANTYYAPGIHIARFRVHTLNGQTLTYTVPVTVHLSADLHRDVLTIWNGFVSALTQQDIGRASTYIHSSSAERFAGVLDALRDNLPQILSTFSEPLPIQLHGSLAEYAVTRTIDGVERAFLIYFLRGGDGVWRIAAM